MGILNLFRRATPSLPRIQHPVFGPMEATLVNEDGSFFWQMPDDIPTPKGLIGISCDGSVDGPSEQQVQLWTWIYDNFEHLAKLAEPLLLDRLRDFNLEARFGELVWSGAGLSADGDKAGEWDISFELKDGILTAYFKGGIPTIVSFDD